MFCHFRKFYLSFILILLISFNASARVIATPLPSPLSTNIINATTSPAPTPLPTFLPFNRAQLNEIESVLLFDLKSGQTLLEKNADTKQYPASVTKIMTALLLIERCQDLDGTKITATKEILKRDPDSTHMALQVGETLTARQLLYAMLLPSANDAAIDVATYLGGSIEGFAAMMNERALSLGMKNTHYVNPHGLHDANHYTTALDLALLLHEAMKHDVFREIVKTQQYTIPPTNKMAEARPLASTNHLIKAGSLSYQYAIGVKTGYTVKAKHTFVGAAYHPDLNMELGVIILKSESRNAKFLVSTKLFTWGFESYRTINVADAVSDRSIIVDIKNASSSDALEGKLTLTAEFPTAVYKTGTQKEISDFLSKMNQLELVTTPDVLALTAPIEKGAQVATFQYLYEGKPIITGVLKASRAVSAKSASLIPDFGELFHSKQTETKIVLYILITLAICFAGLLIWMIIHNMRIRKRQRIERRRKLRQYQQHRKY